MCAFRKQNVLHFPCSAHVRNMTWVPAAISISWNPTLMLLAPSSAKSPPLSHEWPTKVSCFFLPGEALEGRTLRIYTQRHSSRLKLLRNKLVHFLCKCRNNPLVPIIRQTTGHTYLLLAGQMSIYAPRSRRTVAVQSAQSPLRIVACPRMWWNSTCTCTSDIAAYPRPGTDGPAHPWQISACPETATH